MLRYLIKLSKKSNPSKDGQEKFQLFLLAPKSWGRKKLMKVSNTSEQKARNVEKLVSEHRILTLSN